MFALVMPHHRSKLLLAAPLGVLLAASLAHVAGFGDNATLLGVPLGRQTIPHAAGDWKDALHNEASAHELRDWRIDGFSRLGYTSEPRQAYYRAVLVGTVHGTPVTVNVELRADDGSDWTLAEWSETR
jgi:hypothetical protein